MLEIEDREETPRAKEGEYGDWWNEAYTGRDKGLQFWWVNPNRDHEADGNLWQFVGQRFHEDLSTRPVWSCDVFVEHD